MIHLLAVIFVNMLILMAMRDGCIAGMGFAALAIGCLGGLAKSGIIKEALGKVKVRKVMSAIMPHNRETFDSPAGALTVQVVRLPKDLKAEIYQVARLRHIGVNALIIESLRDRIWLEKTLEAEDTPSVSEP